MPEPPLDTRQESIKYVGASSFGGDPISFNANGGAPSRHAGAPSRYASYSDDRGKAVVVEGNTDMSGLTGKELMNVASSSSSSTVAETQDMYNNLASGSSSQHDKTEDTPMNESDAHLYWLMELREQFHHDADPHRVQGPEDLMLSTSSVTFQVPGFSMGLAGGIVPFAEWQSVEDPDDVGLKNLDIFMVMNP